jgi:PAS domain S-box-containing protein
MNITEDKSTVGELSRLRAALDSTSDAIFLVKTATRLFVEVNATACNMLGYSRDELLLLGPIDLGFGTADKGALGYGTLADQQDANEVVETQLQCKDGSRLHVEIRRHKKNLGGDRILIDVVSDITHRKHTTEALYESEERIRAITANLPGMVFQCLLETTSGAHSYTYVSEGAKFLFGLAPDTIKASWDSVVVHLDKADRGTFHASLQHSANEMEAWNWEGLAILDDGSQKWINARATPRFSEGGDVIWDGVMLNITASKKGEKALIQSGKLLRELSIYTEVAREEERKRIAREVHDGLGQTLTVLRMDLDLMRLYCGAQNPELEERVRTMKLEVDKTIKIMRRVTSMLRPTALDLGLVSGLEWLAEEFNRSSGIHCLLVASGCGELKLEDSRATALFRIVQESLNNVVRHAEADTATVSIEMDGDHRLFLEVRDDGKGFDTESKSKADSFGLVGMRERALMLRGTLNIQSAPGGGTSIEVHVPLS